MKKKEIFSKSSLTILLSALTLLDQISDDKYNNCHLLCIFNNYQLEISLYVKLKDWMSNSIDPDETAHYEPSHLDLRCLQKPTVIAYERV